MAGETTATGRTAAAWQPRGAEIGYEVFRFLGILILTLIGLIFITFVIGRLVPIDPVLSILGDRAPPEAYERVRRELGIDLPVYQQFWIYLMKVMRGDFGTSAMTSQPVLYDLGQFFPATLELATAATLIGVVIGIPLGVIAATNHGRWIDHVTRVIGLVGYSIPIFWMGLIGLLVFYSWLDLVAGPGRLDIAYDGLVEPVTGLITIDSAISGDWDVFFNALSHLVLPASLLGYLTLAYVSRMTRSFMLAQLNQEYILTARAKGMTERRVVWRHALGNIVVPLITVVALSYASLLEGAVLTETVFAWPGLGLYITRSLFNADMNAVLGGTMLIGAIFVCLNVFCDMLYRLLDPRARA
jgi:peptide/nickel transport system permease protein